MKEIMEMLSRIEQKVDSMDQRLDGMDQRLDGMDQRLDGMDQRLDGMDQRLDGMDKRLDGMDQRLDEMGQKNDKMNHELTSLKLTIENVTNKNICIIAEGHAMLNRKLDEAMVIEREKELMYLRLNHLEDEVRIIKEKISA